MKLGFSFIVQNIWKIQFCKSEFRYITIFIVYYYLLLFQRKKFIKFLEHISLSSEICFWNWLQNLIYLYVLLGNQQMLREQRLSANVLNTYLNSDLPEEEDPLFQILQEGQKKKKVHVTPFLRITSTLKSTFTIIDFAF